MRLHVLEPDPVTAPVVVQIFAMFLDGCGYLAIAERLTAQHLPPPSGHDRARNPHRLGVAWSKSAVRAILSNPRYTGYQVWNKQRVNDQGIHQGVDQRIRHPDRCCSSLCHLLVSSGPGGCPGACWGGSSCPA